MQTKGFPINFSSSQYFQLFQKPTKCFDRRFFDWLDLLDALLALRDDGHAEFFVVAMVDVQSVDFGVVLRRNCPSQRRCSSVCSDIDDLLCANQLDEMLAEGENLEFLILALWE